MAKADYEKKIKTSLSALKDPFYNLNRFVLFQILLTFALSLKPHYVNSRIDF